MKATPHLDRVHGPEDLKTLSYKNLALLAREIRELIIQVVSENGGHLASNLGVVELTLALHRVFDSPRDKIIWDVGHQCYTHKLVTGRRERFTSLRKLGGLSGFPKRAESEHDIVDTGHASTSISAALGLLQAQRILGAEGKVIAVIGDGALTGGLALEALNQAAQLGRNLIIVLNDNKMSIEKNIGAISSYLSRLATTRLYQDLRRYVNKGLRQVPLVGDELLGALQRLEKGFKALLLRENLFSDLGFEYVGPIDGHNLRLLEQVFHRVRQLDKPTVVHVQTLKGKGYPQAEGNPTLYHGVAPFCIEDGKIEKRGPLTFTGAFSRIITRLAAENPRLVAVTAAMTEGTGLGLFQSLYPERLFDVGIAEAHAVTFASGMAAGGLKPVVAVYSTFMQRAADQVFHDVALPGLPVIFAVDRAGLVGADGETHHGVFDIPLFRSVPGLTLLSPASAVEMEIMFRYALTLCGPVMIRYPKGPCLLSLKELSQPISTGRGIFVRQRRGEVLILGLGGLLGEALKAAELLQSLRIRADVYNLRFIQPLDGPHLMEVISPYSLVCLLEEGASCGGMGEAVASLMVEQGIRSRYLHWGVPERFIPQGSREELLDFTGLDAPHIAAAIELAAEKKGPIPAYQESRF